MTLAEVATRLRSLDKHLQGRYGERWMASVPPMGTIRPNDAAEVIEGFLAEEENQK